MSKASEDFPPPDGPQTAVNLRNGMRTSIPLRLWVETPSRTIGPSAPGRSLPGAPRSLSVPSSPLRAPPGERGGAGRDLLGPAASDDAAAVLAASRAEVHDAVGRPDDVGMMLDGDDRPAEGDELLERREEVLDVGPVEARRRLLQDIEDGAGRRPAHLGGELHALRLASRKSCRALAELEIAEAEALQDLEAGRETPRAGVERGRLRDAHLQDVVDRLAAVPHGERLVVEAAALAVGADDVDVAQEVHADLQEPRALACLAPAAGDVEREPALAEALGLRFGECGEQVADPVGEARVGRRIGPGRPADGGLVDLDDPAHGPFHRDAVRVRSGSEAPGPEPFGQDAPDERGLARARHPRHDVQGAEEELGVERLEVVQAGPPDEEPPRSGAALGTDRGDAVPRQVIAGQALAARQPADRGRRTLIEDPAARLPRARPEVDEMVGRAHDVLVVLDDENGVAVVAELGQQSEKPGGIGRMKAGRRLVEDVKDPAQPAPGLRGQPDALDLAAGERVGGAVEAQVAEPEAFEERRRPEQGIAHRVARGTARRVESHVPELRGQSRGRSSR